MENTFVWADLSTFDIEAARRFYSECFGWKYHSLSGQYVICKAEGKPAAGLYPMPEKFQKIGMPSFWMSYIQVKNIHETVRIAEECGGKIEVWPEAAPGGGVIALIRDPAGAGFTCYEGENLHGQDAENISGRMLGNELHVSDLSKVEHFYKTVFGWKIRQSESSNRYEISVHSGKPIASIQVTENAIKGDKQYWGVYFAVHNLPAALERIERAGGQVATVQPMGAQDAFLVFDPQGAAFYVLEGAARTSESRLQPEASVFKWRAITGLFIIVAAIILEATWIWGLLFLLWVIPDLKHGSTHLLEHVERRRNPVVYWMIISTWISLSIYLLFAWVAKV